MKTRAITGFFFVLVLVAATLFNPYVFAAFFSLVAVLAAREFFNICQSEDTKPLTQPGTITALVLSAVFCFITFGYLQPRSFLLIVPFIVLLFVSSLYLKREKPFHDIAYTILGILYGTVPFLFFISLGFLNKNEFDPYIPLGFLILLWTNDTGAYLTGRAFGRTKLFERISPNKTWEGFIGGVLLAIGISFILNHYFGGLSTYQWVGMATIIGVFGTLGDLVESMLKRSLGIKDSGQILPGHGGFLDRFDGLLIAAPLVYSLLLLF